MVRRSAAREQAAGENYKYRHRPFVNVQEAARRMAEEEQRATDEVVADKLAIEEASKRLIQDCEA